MNAVEIEEAVSALAERPFDATEFPFLFLEAFGNKEATIKKLRAGASNKSDIGGVLQVSNIHLSVAEPGAVGATLDALRKSDATQNKRHKVRFLLATDGEAFEAEDLETGETVACAYRDFPNHFGFFLPLAGISTVKQIRENSFDIRATSRLNRLYVELLKDNPAWGTAERRPDMNHFMARLIFCFFAEDTDIFNGEGLFTATIEQMSARDSSDTDLVISEIFRAMNTKVEERQGANLRSWANGFPYVNGGLFSGSTEVPKFSKIARSYLLHIGKLNWKLINPDIFGSMIQAVADDEERGALGMHYTSVPNILKVLNPLFLDDLREKLEEAGNSPQKLLNLRKRMARIRVFDPACGSGNFLVIAYKEMRAIEAEINKRRGEEDRHTDIPLTNFRGIELRDFPAEIARLALIIAEFQCDVLYRGPKLALLEFLPLDAQNWITCGNALQLDWLSICPPTGTGVKLQGDDLFSTPLDQPQIDFENEGGETYICGNPPYRGSSWQSEAQKVEIQELAEHRATKWKCLDYVCGWIIKAVEYLRICESATAAFVTTKTVCEGEHVPALWPYIFESELQISFARTRFDWANLASRQAGVTVVVFGLASSIKRRPRVFSDDGYREVDFIGPYLIPNTRVIVTKSSVARFGQARMVMGNKPTDGGNYTMSAEEGRALTSAGHAPSDVVRPYVGADELVKGTARACIWLYGENEKYANSYPRLRELVQRVDAFRRSSPSSITSATRVAPHRFIQVEGVSQAGAIAVAAITTENRQYLPANVFDARCIFSNKCYAMYDAELWNLAILVSRLHFLWIGAVSARMRTGFSYSNTLGWNNFPIPTLTDKNKADLERCAENILLARENYFPATIMDMYDPERMDSEFSLVREAHDRNDEVLERIYIGRRFKNDTERLEKLFELYTKMTEGQGAAKKRKVGGSA